MPDYPVPDYVILASAITGKSMFYIVDMTWQGFKSIMATCDTQDAAEAIAAALNAQEA